MNWVKFKAQNELKKKSAGKSSKLKGKNITFNMIWRKALWPSKFSLAEIAAFVLFLFF